MNNKPSPQDENKQLTQEIMGRVGASPEEIAVQVQRQFFPKYTPTPEELEAIAKKRREENMRVRELSIKRAIGYQRMRFLETEERFLLDRAVRRKYGEDVGDAESEEARLREIAPRLIRTSEFIHSGEFGNESDEKSGSSAIHS